MKMMLSLIASVLVVAGTIPAAQAVTCDPSFQGVDWYICNLERKSYPMGMNTETRDECNIEKLPLSGCEINLDDITKGKDADQTTVYAVGTLKQKESLENNFKFQQERSGCGSVGQVGLEEYALMSFADAPQTDNGGRSLMVIDKLKMQGKAILVTVGKRDVSNPTCETKNLAAQWWKTGTTDTVFVKVTGTIGGKGSSSAKGSPAGEGGKKANPLGGLKNIFKKK